MGESVRWREGRGAKGGGMIAAGVYCPASMVFKETHLEVVLSECLIRNWKCDLPVLTHSHASTSAALTLTLLSPSRACHCMPSLPSFRLPRRLDVLSIPPNLTSNDRDMMTTKASLVQ